MAITSSITTCLPSRLYGTLPQSIISASLYPIDVLPVPGFPTRMTLFFLRLDSTLITLSRTSSRPINLSYLPFAISSCKLMVYLLINGVFPFWTNTFELISLFRGILVSWWLLLIYELSTFFTLGDFCSVSSTKSRQFEHILSYAKPNEINFSPTLKWFAGLIIDSKICSEPNFVELRNSASSSALLIMSDNSLSNLTSLFKIGFLGSSLITCA